MLGWGRAAMVGGVRHRPAAGRRPPGSWRPFPLYPSAHPYPPPFASPPQYEPADDGYGGDPASAHNPADETFLLSAERARRVAGVSRAAAVAGDPWAALRLELVQQVLASTDPWRASRGRSRLLANPPVAVVSRATLRPPQAPPVGMSALVARTVAGARMAETRALLAALEDRIVGLEARRAAAAAAGGEGDGGSGGGRE